MSCATKYGHGIMLPQTLSCPDGPTAAGFSQFSERSPLIANGRPSISVVRALSHGLARFQSKVSSTTSITIGMPIRTAATASAIFVRRGLFIAESYQAPTIHTIVDRRCGIMLLLLLLATSLR